LFLLDLCNYVYYTIHSQSLDSFLFLKFSLFLFFSLLKYHKSLIKTRSLLEVLTNSFIEITPFWFLPFLIFKVHSLLFLSEFFIEVLKFRFLVEIWNISLINQSLSSSDFLSLKTTLKLFIYCLHFTFLFYLGISSQKVLLTTLPLPKPKWKLMLCNKLLKKWSSSLLRPTYFSLYFDF